jgi:hypothetical protein
MNAASLGIIGVHAALVGVAHDDDLKIGNR